MGSEENQNSTVVPAKILHLTELHKLRQIFKEGQKLDQCLKNLEELYVNECSSLLNLGPSLITFNLLKTLKVKYCKQLLYLMASVTKNLDQLEELEIEYCGMIKEIIVDNIVIDAETIDEITFSKLKSLKLYALPKLECFCSMNYIFKFPSLEVVIITQCPKMKIFSRRAPNTPKLREVKDNYRSDDGYWERDLNFTVQKLYIDKLYYQLEDLSLSEYPELKQIWHNQLPHGSFRKLNTLTISSCEWSSKVLPLNVLKCLVNLVELKVECCKLLEVVFDLKEDTDEKKDSVILKKLLRLTLTSLPNLKHVWNEDPQGILDFPELYDLTLVDVPKPEHLSIEKAFPNLKGMKVDKAVMTWLGQFPEDHFNKLQYLILTFFNDANTRFPYAFLQKMSKLNDLVILDSSFEEIFPIENEAVGENQHGVALNPTLKSLENLYIKNCSSLLNLVPSTTTFNLLKRLIVEKCEKLLYLIAPSTAKSLGQLEQLQIIECGMMKEIIIDKLYDAEITDEITFSKLHRLELENLPSLECFCSMKYVFNFPSLCEVYIRQCPKMKMFSNGVTSTPKLYSVRHDDPYGPINGYWEDDLNSTVQMMHRDQVASESKDHSSLDVDTNIKNEQLNEPDWNHRVTDEKVKESKREEEHKEYGEVKVGIKIMNVIEKSTTSCLGSRDTNLQTSENQEDQISEHERDCKGKSSERPSIGDIKNATSSSLDSFVEEPMSELVFKGHQAELEQNQVTNEFLDRTDATSEVLHSTIELINNSLSIFSTSKELQHVDRSSTIPQSFSSIANAAELSIGCALEEAFDQKKGTSEIEMIQMKLALESNDKEDSHPQHSSEDTLASSPGIHHQNKESILCGQNGKGNNHGEDKEGVVPNQGNKDIDVITVAFPLSRLRLCIISLYLSCFVLLGCYFLLACWGSGMPLVSIPPTFPFQNKESTLVGQNGKSNSLGEGKDGTIQEGVMPGKYDGTVVSPLSRLQLCAIALSFSCLALMGCYFLSAHRGSRMPSVSVSPSFPIVKDTIELNKDQIYLLREAFARYPNLGAPQEDFSPRFHGWGYKTLADLLHFLKTENHVTITKEREKEFHMLCNEAIHFGFDKIWVEEMRKRVVEDPEVDHAQKRFFEILEKEKELRREKEMLNEFLQGRKKKCFDFL
ncbi:hypothetical protein L6164_008671 [Bauhinia variegata]|nr:hypothetical protein L6164_008671 [Bauhinia variegata]